MGSLEDPFVFYGVNYFIIHNNVKTQKTAERSTWPASIIITPTSQKEKEATTSMGHALDTAETGERLLITTDIPGYRTLPGWNQHFFIWLKEESPPSQEVNHQLQEATGSRIKTGSYFETLIHRGKLHWRIGRTTICKGLQSHFERISTSVLDVSHWSRRLEEN